MGYLPQDIEKKWQKYWETSKTFRAQKSSKKKYYILDMFPYPSGAGLHVGHVEGYTATDIMARYKRMQGLEVLHPMGWDAFGLPAEQYAIKTGEHPRLAKQVNVEHFRAQLKRMGFSYDWDREIDTTDPHFYKWTQWIFKKIYEKGLAYVSHAPVNWCPALGTILANEEVVNGVSEVGGHPVERKPVRQWVLKITQYAEELLKDLDELDWPESTKEMQRHWIGKRQGVDVIFYSGEIKIKIFTTRVDTIFGVTFLGLAPEHPLLGSLVQPEQKELVKKYQEASKRKSDQTRQIQKDITGVFTGSFATHPLTGKKIPIYVSDYILMGYAHGAIMGVPAHDERDYALASFLNLEIQEVLDGPLEESGIRRTGRLVHSGEWNGQTYLEAMENLASYLEDKKLGKKVITYRLRDWIFSRQRYWGEPFPILYDEEGNHHLLEDDDLPLLLPDMDDYRPSSTGEPPLSRKKDWMEMKKDGKSYSRESNIMPQWAGSCWYYLRFLDPENSQSFCSSEEERYWMPVDLYVGGGEHATLHLLYARFWHKVLYDLGLVSHREPFKKLIHPGIILGDNREKMSKSRGNVVNPDDVVSQWGADALRLFEMFLGPIEQSKPWNPEAIQGVSRFLHRVWNLLIEEDGSLKEAFLQGEDSELEGIFHKTLGRVSHDTENWKFHTAIAAMMSFLNEVQTRSFWPKDLAKQFVLMLAPYAPHICEELWERLGHSSSLAYEPWPEVDCRKIPVRDTAEVSFMVNGKHRGTISLPHGEKHLEKIRTILEGHPLFIRYIQGKTILKTIYVPGKVINFLIQGA